MRKKLILFLFAILTFGFFPGSLACSSYSTPHKSFTQPGECNFTNWKKCNLGKWSFSVPENLNEMNGNGFDSEGLFFQNENLYLRVNQLDVSGDKFDSVNASDKYSNQHRPNFKMYRFAGKGFESEWFTFQNLKGKEFKEESFPIGLNARSFDGKEGITIWIESKSVKSIQEAKCILESLEYK